MPEAIAICEVSRAAEEKKKVEKKTEPLFYPYMFSVPFEGFFFVF